MLKKTCEKPYFLGVENNKSRQASKLLHLEKLSNMVSLKPEVSKIVA
jgi:hypothetical protein